MISTENLDPRDAEEIAEACREHEDKDDLEDAALHTLTAGAVRNIRLGEASPPISPSSPLSPGQSLDVLHASLNRVLSVPLSRAELRGAMDAPLASAEPGAEPTDVARGLWINGTHLVSVQSLRLQ